MTHTPIEAKFIIEDYLNLRKLAHSDFSLNAILSFRFKDALGGDTFMSFNTDESTQNVSNEDKFGDSATALIKQKLDEISTIVGKAIIIKYQKAQYELSGVSFEGLMKEEKVEL